MRHYHVQISFQALNAKIPSKCALNNNVGFEMTFEIENIRTMKISTTSISSKRFAILKIIFLNIR